MTGPEDNTAEHAAALYPDMQTDNSAAATARTASPQAGTGTRGSAVRSTTQVMPWDRLYAGSAGALVESALGPNSTHQQVRRTQQATSGASKSDFDALYGSAHRDADPPQLSLQQVVTEQQSAHAALYPEGGQPLESADAYSREALGESFDGVQAQARHDRDAAEEAALTEGRKQASALLAEWQVPGETARGIARELDGFNQRWMKGDLPTDEALEAGRHKTEVALRKEWGPRYDANVELARRTYKEAAKHLPWLANLVEETGAGNSPALIRHFATVGLKNVRNRRASGRNRR